MSPVSWSVGRSVCHVSRVCEQPPQQQATNPYTYPHPPSPHPHQRTCQATAPLLALILGPPCSLPSPALCVRCCVGCSLAYTLMMETGLKVNQRVGVSA